MPKSPSAKAVAEQARKIRTTAERELRKALDQVANWRRVLAALGGKGDAIADEALPAKGVRVEPRRKRSSRQGSLQGKLIELLGRGWVTKQEAAEQGIKPPTFNSVLSNPKFSGQIESRPVKGSRQKQYRLKAAGAAKRSTGKASKQAKRKAARRSRKPRARKRR
jgi:hypothetical protein